MSFLGPLLGLDRAGQIEAITAWEWSRMVALPAWVWVLVGVLALAAAGLNFLPQNVMPWRTRLGLAALRLVGCALLLVMLAQLEARLTVRRALPARLAIVTDVSGSMGLRDADGQTRLAAANAFAAELARAAPGVDLTRRASHWRLPPYRRAS